MYREYWQYTKNDKEQSDYKMKMELSYVAFIDILGFKEMAEQDIDKVILALRMIKAFSIQNYRNVNGYKFLSSDDEREFDEEVEPKVTTFSDSIVISAKEKYYYLNDFIWCLSNLQYELLKKGIAIRGGIEIGYIYHDEFMVFGDGLISAYELESKSAKVPRIVIGPKAMKRTDDRYNEAFENKIDASLLYNFSELEKADIYNNYYSGDAIGPVVSEKGIHYIDYLLDNFEIYFPSEKVFLDIKNVIKIGLNHKEAAVKTKYEWLKKYYNWTIDRCLLHICEDDEENMWEQPIEQLKM